MEQWISSGRVTVNGDIAQLGCCVGPDDRICVDGRPLKPISTQTRVLLYHKPVDEICSRHDPHHSRTVYQNLPSTQGRWMTVGRLDINSSGLLLITNDGDLAQRLAHPSFHLDRTYLVRALGEMSSVERDALLRGVKLDDGMACFTKLMKLPSKTKQTHNHWYKVTIAQGRNRIVRRLFESQELRVNRLIRVGFGRLALPKSLEPGEYIELDAAAVKALKTATD